MFPIKPFSLLNMLAAAWLGLALVGCTPPVQAPVEEVETESRPPSPPTAISTPMVSRSTTPTLEKGILSFSYTASL